MKKNPKLRELERWTLIKHWDHILEFLWIDWVYARWRSPYWWDIIIMWHANQNVWEYWEILNPNDEDHDW